MGYLWLFRITLLLIIPSVVLGQSDDAEPNLDLIVNRNSLTLYVASSTPVSLTGLSLRVVNSQGIFQAFDVTSGFSVLQLTEGLAAPNSCFLYILSGEPEPPLSNLCSDSQLIFRQYVLRSDVFWYDFSKNNVRDIAVLADGEFTGYVCSSSVVDCMFSYVAPDVVLPTATSASVAATITARAEARFTLEPSEPIVTPDVMPLIQHNNEWKAASTVLDGAEMVLVPPGCFNMGNENGEPDEQPVSFQCVDELFLMDRYEVTNIQYKLCVDAGACELPIDTSTYNDLAYADYPVEVNWPQAVQYATWRRGRLPTEKEWEYAARGPDGWIYPWGNDNTDKFRLNFCDLNCPQSYRDDSILDGYSELSPVGSFPEGASWVGAMDMAGNAWEWTSTIYDLDRYPYPYNPFDGREDQSVSDMPRVLRGSTWFSAFEDVRLTRRNRGNPSSSVSTAPLARGIRIVRQY